MILDHLNEDMIGQLAARFDTFPDQVQMAAGQYVPVDETPSFYKGYISGVMMVAHLMSEQKVPVNCDVLIALAGKAARLRKALLDAEQDTTWLDQVDAWLTATFNTECAKAKGVNSDY